MDDIIKNLNDKHYRMTQIRKDILECLNDDLHGHTIKDIVEHLKSKNKKVNIMSVYNNIKFLVNQGIVDIYTDYVNKNQIFEIVNKEKCHIHLYDAKNSKEVKINLPDSIKKEIEKLLDKHDFASYNIKIEILGYKKK